MFETMDRDFKRKPELTPAGKVKIAKEHELAKINEQADIYHTEGSDMVITQGGETRVAPKDEGEGKKRHVLDLISSDARNELIIQAREKLISSGGYSPQEIEVETMVEARKLAEEIYGDKVKDETDNIINKVLKTDTESKK